MAKRIPEIKKRVAYRLYEFGDMKIKEIAEALGMSYSSAYGAVKLRDRVNPETGEKFESLSERQDYLARQRVNPETGEKFESRTQYQEHLARQNQESVRGRAFAEFVDMGLQGIGENVAWLAERVGVSRQMVYNWKNGKSVATGERLRRLFDVLGVSNKSLDDLVEGYELDGD